MNIIPTASAEYPIDISFGTDEPNCSRANPKIREAIAVLMNDKRVLSLESKVCWRI